MTISGKVTLNIDDVKRHFLLLEYHEAFCDFFEEVKQRVDNDGQGVVRWSKVYDMLLSVVREYRLDPEGD